MNRGRATEKVFCFYSLNLGYKNQIMNDGYDLEISGSISY